MKTKSIWIIVSLFALVLMTACKNTGSGGANNSRIDNKEEVNNDVLSEYTSYANFDDSSEWKGIYTKDNLYFLATKKGALVPAQEWEYNENQTCFIAFIDGGYNVISSKGIPMIDKKFEQYELYPYGGYVYGKTTDGWNAYDLSEDNPESYFTIDFDDCRATSDGMILSANGDIYLSRTDEGILMAFNLSEEERKQERLEQEEAMRLQLLALIFMNMNAASASQIQQMNNVYDSYNVSSRSRSQIEADITKYEREKSFCESHKGDGIAEGMGYSSIISNYDRMIQDRQQELQYAK